MTFYYTIKNRDNGFFKYTLRKICIIFYLLIEAKPKYVRLILKQIHIFDTKANNLMFQKVYLANTFINFKDQPDKFYKIDLFLKQKNKKFKLF